MAKAVDRPFEPMLAVDAADLSALTYPLLASYKMDGIRAVVTPDGPRTRSLKPIPNRHVHSLLSSLPHGLDGEIGVVTDGFVNFRATTSAVMSHDGAPTIRFFVFDNYLVRGTYDDRYFLIPTGLPDWVEIIAQHVVRNQQEVKSLFGVALAAGHEGLILRRGDAPYKFGRSTLKEAFLLKVKPWEDDEGEVVAITQEFENTNEKTRDERGRAKRSSAKAGKVARERMGTLVCKNPKWPGTFEIGGGFTHADREAIWNDRENVIGRFAKFQYLAVGGYDHPRMCQFLGWRSPEDMSS